MPRDTICVNKLWPHIRNVAVPNLGISRIPIKRTQVKGMEKKKLYKNGILLHPILNGSIATYNKMIKNAMVTNSSVSKTMSSLFFFSWLLQENPRTSAANATTRALRKEFMISGDSVNLNAFIEPLAVLSLTPLSLIAKRILFISSRS